MPADAPYWDPYDAEIDERAHEVWLRLRDEAPVYYNERHDFWALSQFDDVEAAHRDPRTFSSAYGTVLEHMGPEGPGGLRMMIFCDPPDHTRLRSLVSRALTPRRVAALEETIRELCAELLDPVQDAGRFDYLEAFAAQLPSRVISSLMGVPPEDQEQQRRNVDAMFHTEPGVGMANEQSIAAAMDLLDYLGKLLVARSHDPRDDMASALVQAEITDDDGSTRRLTHDECLGFTMLLYTAGTETVGKLLGNAAVILAAHADQRKTLAADPSLLPNAVEELLRYEPPSPVNGRYTAAPVTLHGSNIPKDAKVLLLNGSAGRDGRRFADPDRFDVSRPIRQHLTFGYGVHFCLGAALARLEARVALEETLRRFPEWEVDTAQVKRVNTSTVRGYRSVPITF